MESAIPVTIIAGSFASGKTTFCNEVLGTFEKANVAVISHRFAEEYASQPMVINQSRCGLLEEVYDYGSGCLCCTPGGELNQRLNNMIMWGERYDHVLIRTGPAADPLLFADAVQRSRAYRIAGLITLLDPAMLCYPEQLVSGASLDQLLAADTILLQASKAGDDKAADQEDAMRQLQELLRSKDINVPILSWQRLHQDTASVLHCRPEGRKYICKASNLVPNLIGHDTSLKAVQIVENGTVNPTAARQWAKSLLSQGFCVRMKALLAVKTEHGLQTLMLNATRGQLLQDEVVHDAPAQVYMGDLQILVGNIGHDIDPTQPLSRLFILLGPPIAKGLGDLDDLLNSMPSSVDLAESFVSVLDD